MLIRPKIKIAAATGIALFVLISFSGNHPAGNTGAPGDGICSSCHGGSGGFDGTIDLTGLPSVVDPNETYNLTLTLDPTVGNPILGGFQVVALQDDNDNNAGDWFNNGPGSSLILSGGREYFGHSPAQAFGGGSIDWTADWMPPNITGDVTFYAVGNLANGNGGSSGDDIITASFTVTVDGVDPLGVMIENIENTSCFEGEDGSATAVAEGGAPPYEFEWDNGEDNAEAVNLDAGTHTVTVTDSDGNTGFASAFIDQPDEIEIDPEIEGVSCFDDDDGIADLNPFGGTGGLDCDWPDGIGPGCEQDGLDPGVYFVTVTDENNCSVVAEVEIPEPELLLITLTATSESTAGAMDGTATAAPSGGTPPYSFFWSNGQTDEGAVSMIDNLAAGNYEVTVVDENGCEDEALVVVAPGACAISATADITDVACHGDSTGMVVLEVSNAVDPVDYDWSNGDSSQIISNLPQGNLFVVITDAANCSVILNGINISQPDSLKSSLVLLQHASCEEESDGEIIVGVDGGVGGYDMVWSNGVTNDTIINGMDTLINIPDTLSDLLPGIYNYVLTDANLCMLTDTFEILNSDSIPPVLVLEQGTVYLDSSGNAPPAVFADIDAGSFDNCGIDSVAFATPSFSCDEIMSHTFPVEIFDTAGNGTAGMATIMVIDTIDPVIDCSGIGPLVINTCDPLIYPLPQATDNCLVEFLELTEGLPPGSVFPNGLTIVTYRAIDNCGNSSSCSFTVEVNTDLEITIDSITPVSCSGLSDAEIFPAAAGGTPPYAFEIQGGSFTGLSAGTYSVQVSDAGGCMSVTEVTIDEGASVQDYELETSDVSCAGGIDGSVNLDMLPDNLEWDFDDDADMLAAGSYEITISDAGSGCTNVQVFEIGTPDSLHLTDLSITHPLCHDSEDCEVNFEVTGGTAPFTGEILTVFERCAGPATLLVTDANGCTASSEIDFIRPEPITASGIQIIAELENQNGGSVLLDISGGSGAYIFSWKDENGIVVSNAEDLSDVPAGLYILEVTDTNGCSAEFEFLVDFIDSVDDNKQPEAIRVFPVPATDRLYIQFEQESRGRFSLYDVRGSHVMDFAFDMKEVQLDVSALTPGVYLIKIQREDRIESFRFLKL